MHSEELIIYLSARLKIKVETLTKRRGCKKKKKKILIYNCTLSAVFIWTCGWKGGGGGGWEVDFAVFEPEF